MAQKWLHFLSLCVIIMCFKSFIVHAQGYRLKQVLILSRHNIRTPLTKNLQYVSTHEFPEWKQEPGYLTEKGALMEGYMGEYFREWFLQQGLFSEEECPEDNTIHIYANTKQRTKQSAISFAKYAFKDCNVKVYSIDSDEMDPIFNPVPRNTSIELKEAIMNEMQMKLNKLHLKETYLELNKILNLNQSHACQVEKLCNLAEEHNDVVYRIGIEPNIKGPLNIGNGIVDSFLMSYYEGMPLEKVAWGQLKTKTQWKLLTRITKENQNVRFNSTILAKEVARPLLNYMLEVLSRENPLKFTLLVGHDSNLTPVMASFGFISKDLPGQFERTPVGGKLVFQKIQDTSGNYYVKVDFVYQSFEQLRDGSKLSLENPPLWLPMQIKTCSDQNGYCPWDSFIDLLRNIVYYR